MMLDMPDEPHQMRQAIDAVIESGNASTSFVQRRLGIGYNRAARLIEGMEAAGIISRADTVGKRTILSTSPSVIDHAVATAIELDKAAAQAARPKAPPMKDDPDFRKHNQKAYDVTADELRAFIEGFERMESEKADIAGQQKELMSEAKGRGYDTKVLRKIVALRKRKPDEIAEEEAVLAMYKQALGM